MAHKHVIYYFLFRKRGGGGGCLGGLNQIKQPRVADFFFAYPLFLGLRSSPAWRCILHEGRPLYHYWRGFWEIASWVNAEKLVLGTSKDKVASVVIKPGARRKDGWMGEGRPEAAMLVRLDLIEPMMDTTYVE